MANAARARIEDDEDEGDKQTAPAPKSALKKILLFSALALLLIGVSVGGTVLAIKLFATPEAAPKKAPAKAAAEAEEAGEQEAAKPEKAEAEGNKEGEGDKAVYLDFEQPFIVNFMDDQHVRYLQITVAIMASESEAIESVKHHMPLIRNNLVLLFSNQTRETIISREGKEKIRGDAQAEVQKILRERTGNEGIKSLYFTSFVMQ